MATGWGRPKDFAMVQAMSGISRYCAVTPMSISTGRETRMRKSSFESVSPIVSMMNPRIDVWVWLLTQVKASGKKYVKTATAVTNAGVHFVSCADMRWSMTRVVRDFFR
jgi:hypothetical protein